MSEASSRVRACEEVSLGDRLKVLSLHELGALLEAYLSASDALQAVFNMPKLRSDEEDLPASDILDEEMDRLAVICGEIAREAEQREPAARDDSSAKAQLLVTWGIRCGEGWRTIAKIATSALRDES